MDVWILATQAQRLCRRCGSRWRPQMIWYLTTNFHTMNDIWVCDDCEIKYCNASTSTNRKRRAAKEGL